MKQGSRVHKVLEEQVHDIVPIQTQSKEDRFGLKLWNTIQGLRTLRATGLTRELEVWGTVDGQVVNGIIDEVSFTRPDSHFQDILAKTKPGEPAENRPDGQQDPEEYDGNVWPGAAEGTGRIAYIADVKTRGVKSVPVGASLRPTWMQLMLYRKLLEALAQNTVDSDTIFARYDLRPLEPFTDTFMNDMADLDDIVGDEMADGQPSATLPTSEIRSYSNLSALWSLMVSEFGQTVGSVSDVLRAEFRYSRTGELIGSELFTYDTNAVEAYLSKEMEWWKGEREAVGVEVEEAFKCRMCDFAEQCTWRKNKIEEATEKHRLRVAGREKSVV
jgi:exonuclease V